MSILIADHDSERVETLKQLLNRLGQFQVESISGTDLQAGLQAFTPKPLLTLSSLQAQIADQPFWQAYLQDPHWRNVPLLLWGEEHELQAMTEALDAGVQDVLRWPLNELEVKLRLQYTLRLRELNRQVIQLQTELHSMTEQWQMTQAQLEQISFLDDLTGLHNRKSFEQKLQEEWKRSQRHAQPLSLILVDIDFFKPYNDNYGRDKGNECLKMIAQSLTPVRAGDFVARYGPEEFVALLPTTYAEGALAVAEHFRSSVAALSIEHKASLIAPFVTLSLGVGTLLPSSQANTSNLVEITERALTQAKRQGRNRVKVAETSYNRMDIGG